MSEKPQKVIIDVGGTALNTAGQALNAASTIFLIFLSILLVAIGFVLSAGLALGILALVGTLVILSYGNFPKFTSLVLSIPSTVLAGYLFVSGNVPMGLIFLFIALYGVLILPPLDVDAFNLKIKREKLYSIGIRSFTQMLLAGILLALGYIVATDISLKTAEGNDWTGAVWLVILAGFPAYYGCINAKRQKDYLMDPETTIEQWKSDKNWSNLKFLIKKNPSKEIKKLYNEEAIKRGRKPVPINTPTPSKKYLSPGQIERRRKARVAMNVIKQLIRFGPEDI